MTDNTTTATRRGVLVALAGTAAFAGTIGAAIAAPAEAAIPTGEPTPEGMAFYEEAYKDGHDEAMELVARGWLSEWVSKGGTVTLDRRDPEQRVAYIGWPTYELSLAHTADEARAAKTRQQDWFKAATPENQQRIEADNHRFNSTFYDGKMRQLSDMLDAIPGLEDAVKRFVRAMSSASREA